MIENKFFKRATGLVLAVVVPFMFGCANKKEVEKRAVVVGVQEIEDSPYTRDFMVKYKLGDGTVAFERSQSRHVGMLSEGDTVKVIHTKYKVSLGIPDTYEMNTGEVKHSK